MIKTIPADEYHNSPGLSASLAKIAYSETMEECWLESPMNPYRAQQDSTDMDIGTAAHAALLEGLNVVVVCDYKDWRKDAAKAEAEAARVAKKIPLLPHQFQQVKDMVKISLTALSECPDLNGIKWEDGKPEQSIFWKEGNTDCRARLDWLHNDYSVNLDYKSTKLAPGAWMRAIPKMGYDIQAAFHTRGVSAVTGKKCERVFMVQRSIPPYGVYFVGLPPAYLEIGAAKVQIAIDRWQACMERNEWPGYEKRIMYAEIPAWELAEIEEKMITQETWNELAFRFGKVEPKEYRK